MSASDVLVSTDLFNASTTATATAPVHLLLLVLLLLPVRLRRLRLVNLLKFYRITIQLGLPFGFLRHFYGPNSLPVTRPTLRLGN